MKLATVVSILFCLVCVLSADKEEWKKRSIYQLLTDRFARNDGQQYGCDNLGKVPIIKATTAEADTGVLSITWTIFREWASTRSGFLQSSITETEVSWILGTKSVQTERQLR